MVTGPASCPPRDDRFIDAFSTIVGDGIRTKPSYTDCWILDIRDVEVITSYRTDSALVTIGTASNGESIYCVTPKEYAYPDALNSQVLGLIEGVRDRYRKDGGSIDRDSIMGMTRSMIVDRWDEFISTTDVEDTDSLIRDVCTIVHRHSVGMGIFEVLLSDPHIEDVYLDAPCSHNRIHVTVNSIEGVNSHIRCTTNLMVEEREVDNLLNILRRRSGLRFCRTNPVLETDISDFDARATIIGYPLSPNGNAVALRKHSALPWTLSRSIYNGTMDEWTAGVMSFLVNSRATILVCGARGAGKSSLLSALMFEFPVGQRILTIEDTLELPGEYMRSMNYRVQTILVDEKIQGTVNSRSDEALRVSLRLGESAIVMGEVRGDEARTLYQSMRAGRAGSAIMGTVHGDSADSVYKRMVYDIGIAPEAFMATDVLVTLGTSRERRTGNLQRRVNELVSTGSQPGEFICISDQDGLFSSPVLRRILRSMGMSDADALNDIRSRSLMRAYLATKGSEDERFLGPEWIVLANDTLVNYAGNQPADILSEFRRRVDARSHRWSQIVERGPHRGRSDDIDSRIGWFFGYRHTYRGR